MTTLPPMPPEGLKVADLSEEIRSYIRDSLHQGAAIHKFLDLSIDELGPDYAVMSLPLRAEALNGSGNLHGGVVATLIDVTAGTAAARSERYDAALHTLVTADLHVRYLRTPRGGSVSARAEVIQAGKQLIILECKVTDAEGRLIAAADFSMMVVARRGPLTPTA
ncbi:MAG: thioesterase superfamily protein [Marmoricola sp.]|nr:thioesterase superfamily protein [Marmoricola sp.]